MKVVILFLLTSPLPRCLLSQGVECPAVMSGASPSSSAVSVLLCRVEKISPGANGASQQCKLSQLSALPFGVLSVFPLLPSSPLSPVSFCYFLLCLLPQTCLTPLVLQPTKGHGHFSVGTMSLKKAWMPGSWIVIALMATMALVFLALASKRLDRQARQSQCEN